MNTGGPASEKTLLDEFAGQALTSRGLYGANVRENEVAKECYTIASAMLAEKARREAVVQQSSTTESYITDKNGIPVARVTHAPISDHSPDATKMIELQAANRELVEALENVLATQIDPNGSKACKDACAILAKHKGDA